MRRTCATLFALTVSLLMGFASVSAQSTDPPAKHCRAHPQLISKCFVVHGRLSVYNGAPAVRIWRIGTRRVLGVSEQRFSLAGYRNIPEELSKKIDGEVQIVGDFLVCPFTRLEPGKMQLVCIESARNLALRKRTTSP
jgi:hypothetical protein